VGSGIEYQLDASLVIAPVGGQPGVELRGLKIAWETRKTSASSANTAKVQVWNLTKSTRNKIVKKKTALVLRAGYIGLGSVDAQLPLLASGVILRVEHSHPDVDSVSSFELRDGGLGLDDAMFHHAYPKGTLVQDIVDDLIAEMPDAGRGALNAAALQARLSAPRAFSGRVREAFDKVSGAFGFEWSVQDGAVQVLDRTGARGPQVTAVEISVETGMVGSPVLTNAGCKVESLLMPSIVPGGWIKVRSDLVTGYFKVVTVEHSGDSWEGTGRSIAEAKSIDKWSGPGAKSKKPK
jgi:hypothetical protein